MLTSLAYWMREPLYLMGCHCKGLFLHLTPIIITLGLNLLTRCNNLIRPDCYYISQVYMSMYPQVHMSLYPQVLMSLYLQGKY